MALSTAQDLVDFALRISSVTGQGQTASAADEADGLILANMLLSEWQLNRWLVMQLQQISLVSTAAQSYSVGPTGNFVVSMGGQRPDRLDACFARVTATGNDQVLYPFMSREGYDRIAAKGSVGVPESYFYAPSTAPAGNGTLQIYPVPDTTYTLFINAKCDLGQFASLSASLSVLPAQYVTALLWNLAERMRPLYGMQPRADISAAAMSSLQAIMASKAETVQAQVPVNSGRPGVFSHLLPAPRPPAGQSE